MSFSYSLPFSNERLLEGVISSLKMKKEYEVAQMLRGSKISLEEGGYSYYVGGGRTDAKAVYVTFFVNPLNLEALEISDIKLVLKELCDNLIPSEVGFDIKSVNFEMDLSSDYELEDDLIVDLESQSDRISGKVLAKILPQDIKEKGYYMSEIYTYLYAIENSLRLFIEEIFKEEFGDEYFEHINVSSSLRNTISSRVEKSEQNKWLSVRGTSKLFYLDFKDLAALINNNWDLFKNYFPSQDFILPKLQEMAECRNLIAHNSLVGETERNILKTYYNVILKQISSAYKI